MKQGYEIASLAFSFYNSFSLLNAELEGRFYGGGVLELTPNEFKKIPLPYLNVSEKDINKLDDLLRKKTPLNIILDFTDDLILKKGHGFKEQDVVFFREVRAKLVERRIKINTQSFYGIEDIDAKLQQTNPQPHP